MKIDYPRSEYSGVRRFVPSWRQWLSLFGLGVLATVAAGVFLYVTVDIPSPNDLATAQATTITWDDGQALSRIADANRRSIAIDAMPADLQNAVLSAEDRTFYENSGFSLPGIVRAGWTNVRSGSTVGGSTITQQYAKNAYLTQEKTFTRKAKELVMSVKLSQSRSKQRILEDYLNTIYFGRGAYGVESAASVYFGKSAKELTASESAVLAAIIRSPGGYSPESNLDRLEGRWEYVLDGMVVMGNLTEEQRAEMVFPTIKKKSTSNTLGGDTGYLVEMVRRELTGLGYTEEEIARGGFRVKTTFNRDAQEAAREAIDDAGPSSGTDGLRIGLAAVRPNDGAVVAIYGGDDYIKNQLNNATQGIQQAGSTFKPFALAAGLEDGFTLRSTFEGRNDSTFEFPGFEPYEVPNFDNASYGSNVSLLRATKSSINTAYVDLSLELGPQAVVDAAERAGIPADTPGLNAGPTTVLGTASPRTIDMAAAYATFANQGLRNNPYVVSQIIGPNGGERYAAPSLPARAFEADIANEVTYALTGVVTDGSGFAARSLGRPSAGKTGTTNENKSAWYVGYTPEISVAISMSKSDDAGNPITLRGTGGLNRITGGSFPARMWTAFVDDYLGDSPVQQFPGRAGLAGDRDGDSNSDSNDRDRPSQAPATTAPPTAAPTSKPTTKPTVKPTTKPTVNPPVTTAPPTGPPDPDEEP